MERNIPSAHGVPLEGEWSVCASGRVINSLKVSASGSNADSSSRPGRLPSVDETELKSRGRGMGECASVDEWSWPVETPKPVVQIPKGCCQLGRADGNANCKGMSVDGQDKSGKFVPTTVELDDPGGGETPSVCLGGTKTRVGEVESHNLLTWQMRTQSCLHNHDSKISYHLLRTSVTYEYTEVSLLTITLCFYCTDSL